MNQIILKQITKTYSLGSVAVPALKGVSLNIRKADFVAVAGPSGSGKTTMMNIIGLIDTPTSGILTIEGRDVSDLSRKERTLLRGETLGFIFQSFNLISVLSVYENIELPLTIGRNPVSAAQRHEIVVKLIDEVSLAGRENHRPSELSGGQQQRVAVARALVKNPPIVIADEPTANLDSETGHNILELMKRINREHGTTFIFSTHDPVIREMADHVVHLHDGLIINEERKNGADAG